MPRNRLRSFAVPLAAAAMALAGCASERGLPLRPPVVVPAQPGVAAQGQADVLVRSFVATGDNTRAEVSGARCRIESILFKTELTTPARLVFPGFGPQSPTLAVSCRAGALSGGAEQGVTTRWVSAPGGGWGPGPWGPGPWGYGGWGYGGWGGPWGWSGPSYPTFVYPPIDVMLTGPAGAQAALEGGAPAR